jgi:hypothetical protein
LLFKLLFSRPSELFDRVKTAAEEMASPPQSPRGSDDIPMSKAFARFITDKRVGLSLAGNRFGVAFKR